MATKTDRHPEDLKAAIRKTGVSMTELALRHGLLSTTITRQLFAPIKGIDPGFAYNPGKAWKEGTTPPGEGGAPLKVPGLPGDPEGGPKPAPAAPAGAARPLPAEVEAGIRRFAADPRGSVPVGSLPAPLRDALGAKQPTALLSADTFEKQVEHHPEMTADEYAALPELLLDPAMAALDRNGRLLLFKPLLGTLLHAVVKTTESGYENYVVSVRRSGIGSALRLLKRARLLLGDAEALREGERRAGGASP